MFASRESNITPSQSKTTAHFFCFLLMIVYTIRKKSFQQQKGNLNKINFSVNVYSISSASFLASVVQETLQNILI
jgi:hypothetical protein